MQCKHCLSHYNPCLYNSNRQKYCSKKDRPSCYQKRKANEAKEWRQLNPDYFKNDNDRTAAYLHQKNETRQLKSTARKAVSEIKREFVSHFHASALVLEKQLLTFVGLLVSLSGGLDNASAFSMSNQLQKCYKNGVILKEFDITLKTYLENINESILKFDQSSKDSADPPTF